MRNTFGPFEFAFERVNRGVPPYLQLLGLSDDAAQHVRTIQHLGTNPDNRVHLVNMLHERNWRPQLVAIIAGTTVEDLEAPMWSAVDRGSWVTPQIVAVLSLVDQTFIVEADHRIETGCLIQFRDHDDPVVVADLIPFPKMDASLRALRGLEPSPNPDPDNSGRHAISWRKRFEELCSAASMPK